MAGSRTPRITINEDRVHQRREWLVERIGWAVMALLALAGLSGLLGDGPLSHATAGSPDGLQVRYERLQRAGAPTRYRFRANPALVSDGQLRLRFDARLLGDVKLESMVPQPTQVRTGPGYVEFAFAMDAAQGQPAELDMEYQPTTFGRVRGRITAAGSVPLVIDQFTFP